MTLILPTLAPTAAIAPSLFTPIMLISLPNVNFDRFSLFIKLLPIYYKNALSASNYVCPSHEVYTHAIYTVLHYVFRTEFSV
jgi:hypothetical protein